MPCPKAIHHSSSSLTSNTDMQQGPKQACACDSPATRVNKPWVQKYSTRLTRRKEWRLFDMQGLGQGKDVARIKSSLPKAYYSSSYFQILPLSPFSLLTQLNVHFPYSIPSHSILFSYFSNSPVLHCFYNETSLHIRGVPAIQIDSSPSWEFLITRHM